MTGDTKHVPDIGGDVCNGEAQQQPYAWQPLVPLDRPSRRDCDSLGLLQLMAGCERRSLPEQDSVLFLLLLRGVCGTLAGLCLNDGAKPRIASENRLVLIPPTRMQMPF